VRDDVAPQVKMETTQRMVIFHPSDEMYGADQMILATVRALSSLFTVVVTLPTDVAYDEHHLSSKLVKCGIDVRHTRFVVLRRSRIFSARGVIRTILDSVHTATYLHRNSRIGDVIYLNTSACLLVAIISKIMRRRIVAHIHEVWRPSERRLLGFPLRFCDLIISISEAVRESLPSDLSRRSVVVYDCTGPRTPIPGRRHASNHTIRLLVASRWTLGKGYVELLSAWNSINRSDLQLVILGGPPVVGEGVPVPELVAQLGRPESVLVIGESNSVEYWMASSDVIVVPSVYPEGLCLVALEGLAAGKPVIASNLGGLPEVVTPECGWLYDPANPRELVSIIDNITSSDLERKSTAALDRYNEKFTVQMFESSIKKLVAPCGKRRS